MILWLLSISLSIFSIRWQFYFTAHISLSVFNTRRDTIQFNSISIQFILFSIIKKKYN